MSDRTSQGIAYDVFRALARGFDKAPPAVQDDRLSLARSMLKAFEQCDFDMEDCGGPHMVTLKIAKECPVCRRSYMHQYRADHGAGICDEWAP